MSGSVGDGPMRLVEPLFSNRFLSRAFGAGSVWV